MNWTSDTRRMAGVLLLVTLLLGCSTTRQARALLQQPPEQLPAGAAAQRSELAARISTGERDRG